MTTAAYIRVSTNMQMEGAGPAQQRDNLLAYAAQKGLAIDIWATDDETGTTENREQIQALLAKARSGELKCLLVDRMDRLGRKMHVCESLYEAFTSAGCEVRFVAAHFENNPTGTLMRQIMSSFAEYQRTEMLHRMRQCKLAKAARLGINSHCSVPYGYRYTQDGSKLEENPEEAQAVRVVARLHGAGASLREIAAHLNKDGYRTRTGKNVWYPTQISRLIRDLPCYRAERAFLEDSVAQQPCIIY